MTNHRAAAEAKAREYAKMYIEDMPEHGYLTRQDALDAADRFRERCRLQFAHQEKDHG